MLPALAHQRGRVCIAPTASFVPGKNRPVCLRRCWRESTDGNPMRQDSPPVEVSFKLRRPSPIIGGTERAKNPCYISRDMTASFCGSSLRIANYTVNENLMRKVLDFVRSGGPAGIRTQDTRIKSPVLWPTELPAHRGDATTCRSIHHSDVWFRATTRA